MKQINFLSDNIQNLIEDIKYGRAIAVTDASVSLYTSVGASTFVITTCNLQTSCSGAHGVPPGLAPMDSYRAEIYGIYSIFVCLQHIAKTHNLQKGEILMACDNKTGLYISLAYENRASISQGGFDILWAIHKIRQELPFKTRFQHVKGHQNVTGKFLTLLEKLNCITDKRLGST